MRVLYDKQRLTFFDLFKKNWSQIKKSNFKLKSNNKKKGSIRYKKDNKLFLKKLKNSWDTSVRDVQKIRINI